MSAPHLANWYVVGFHIIISTRLLWSPMESVTHPSMFVICQVFLVFSSSYHSGTANWRGGEVTALLYWPHLHCLPRHQSVQCAVQSFVQQDSFAGEGCHCFTLAPLDVVVAKELLLLPSGYRLASSAILLMMMVMMRNGRLFKMLDRGAGRRWRQRRRNIAGVETRVAWNGHLGGKDM